MPTSTPNQPDCYELAPDARVHDLVLVPHIRTRLVRDWAIYPDHIVFLGPAPVVISRWEQLPIGEPPPVVFFEGFGVFVTSALRPAHLEQLRCFRDVLVRLPQDVEVVTLSPRAIAELLGWDAEVHRQSMADRGGA